LESPLTRPGKVRTLDEDADPEPQRARPPRCEAAPPIVGRLSGRPVRGSSKRPGTASICLRTCLKTCGAARCVPGHCA